jgi:hypothetical protein
MTEQAAATNVRRCRQCREVGHNIRNCPLFDRTHKEALREYQSWIHHCIVDYYTRNKWQYDNIQTNDSPVDINLLTLFHNTTRNNDENHIETVLKAPNTWIQTQTLEILRVLGHFYNFPTNTEPYKSLSKEDWIGILHFILLLEVEQNGTRLFEVSEAVPYLSSSIQCFPALQSIHAHIHTIPNMLPELLLRPQYQLVQLSDRYGKLRELRVATALNLRLTHQDLNENYREEISIRRRMNELRIRRTRVLSNSRQIESRVTKFENDMFMFLSLPPDPPIISFHPFECNNNIDACPICYEPTLKIDMVQLECNHEFCASCILLTISGKFKEHTNELDECLCPYCRKKIDTLYGDVQNMKMTLRGICTKKKLPLDLTLLVGGT